MSELTTKERKKEFDKIFTEKIIPFFTGHGFVRHTKTSTRLIRTFENKLSVFITFDFANRFRSFSISATYFDEEIGDIYDDNYLLMAKLTNNSFSGEDPKSLNKAVDQWILEQQDSLIPFIENHTTHKAILESNQFYKITARKVQIMEVLNRKSKL